jgi:hypothetical protein
MPSLRIWNSVIPDGTGCCVDFHREEEIHGCNFGAPPSLPGGTDCCVDLDGEEEISSLGCKVQAFHRMKPEIEHLRCS